MINSYELNLIELKVQRNKMGFEKLEVLKQTMADEAKAAKPKQVKTANSVEAVVHDIARLQKHFPLAFPKNPLPKVPLKIGILEDLKLKSNKIGLSEDRLKTALQTWCISKRYRSSVIAGAQRLDLDGNPMGEVQLHEATHAKIQEQKSKANKTKSSSI